MSLADLDRFLARRDEDPELALQLAAPMDLDQFLALALRHGFTLTEAADSLNAKIEGLDTLTKLKDLSTQ